MVRTDHQWLDIDSDDSDPHQEHRDHRLPVDLRTRSDVVLVQVLVGKVEGSALWLPLLLLLAAPNPSPRRWVSLTSLLLWQIRPWNLLIKARLYGPG
jgi:hypothetical protein